MTRLPQISGTYTRRKPKQRMVLWFAMFCLGIGAFVAFEYHSKTRKVIPLTEAVEVELRPGMAAGSWFNLLETKGISYPKWVRWVWLRFESSVSTYQAGLYRFEGGFSLAQMNSDLRDGVIYEPIVFEVTIPEGFTYSKISARMMKLNIGTQREWTRLFRDASLLGLIGLRQGTLEGFVFPATYRFVHMPNPYGFLSTAIQTFKNNIPADYAASLKRLNITLKDAVTIASMIEAETRIDEEKPMVSEVIWNRLKRKELLGIDATIIYGIEDYDGDIKWKHLRDKSNPYNTRIHRGLPPSPIGSPGLEALKAVVAPTQFGYLFYVASVEKLGYHHFSKTSAEHNSYVKKLVKYEKSRSQK